MEPEHNYEAMLLQALTGDIHALQRLFAAFQRPLKTYLYRLLANRSDAEDILHDAFIRAYDKLGTFRAESSLKIWMFQIAMRLAQNLLASRRRWTPDVSAQAKRRKGLPVAASLRGSCSKKVWLKLFVCFSPSPIIRAQYEWVKSSGPTGKSSIWLSFRPMAI